MDEQHHYAPFFAFTLIVAVALLGAGYVVGRTTVLAPYSILAIRPVQRYTPAGKPLGSVEYLQFKGDSSIYVISPSQLVPKFNPKALTATSRVSLTIMPDATSQVDFKASPTVEIKGAAYQVMALAIVTGKSTASYATPQYNASPGGYKHLQATLGHWITIAGIAMLILIVSVIGLAISSFVIVAGSEELDFDLHSPSPWQLAAGLLFGALFIVFNFPIGVTNLGKALKLADVQQAGSVARTDVSTIFGVTAGQRLLSFHSLWSAFVFGAGAYLVVLAILSLRHLRLDLFGLGVLFLAIGAASIHLIVWLVVGLLWLLSELGALLGWIFHYLGIAVAWVVHLLALVTGFLVGVFVSLVALISRLGLWAVVVLVLAGALIFLIVRYREAVWEFIKALGGVALFVAIAALVVGAFILLVKLFQFLLPFLAPVFAFLGRIFGFLVFILFYVVIGLGIGWLVYGLGSFILDQCKGGWNAGNGRRGVMLGSLAVGTSAALILMETNLYGAVGYFPGEVAGFITTYLHQGSPIFDVLIGLVVLAISILGLLRNLPKLLDGPGLREFQTALVLAVVGVVLGMVLIVLAHATGDSSG